MQSLVPIHCFLFEIEIIKNGFAGPINYRVFRETGPRAQLFKSRLTLGVTKHRNGTEWNGIRRNHPE